MSSGNSLDFTKEDLDLFNAHGVAVKEMEAAAVAWAAHLHATPMFALKAITDIVDGARPRQHCGLAVAALPASCSNWAQWAPSAAELTSSAVRCA